MSRPSEIRLVIDRLVLHGVPAADAAAVAHALRAEVQARLAAAGTELPAGPGSMRLQVPAAATAAGLGREAGKALAASLSAPARSR